MTKLVTSGGTYLLHWHDSEKEFEEAVVSQCSEIFGPNRIYLDCKRRIGAKTGKKNIPDAYLLDFSSPTKPALFLVENELSEHDPFDHIGVQLLQFSVSFPQSGRRVKEILFEEISKHPEIVRYCQKYARDGGFRNLDYLLERLVFESPFRAIVIIDEATDELDTVLSSLGFPVEVVEFKTYSNAKRRIYRFEPFLSDAETVRETKTSKAKRIVSDLDSIVVPARPSGFERVFLGENRWMAIRIHPSMQAQLKYIAAYCTKPISAITHWATIRSIAPWKQTNKFVVNFSGSAKRIGPLKLVEKGKVWAPQAPRYTTSDKIRHAKNLDDVFL